MESYIVKDTIRVDEGDKLFPESDKLCISILVIQKRILALKSEYVRKSESVIRSNRVTSVLYTKVSWTNK